MSEDKPKSTIRQLLEMEPTDPLMLEKLTLLEELQAAHANSDHKTMLEIGRKLTDNQQQTDAANERRYETMDAVVAAARGVADPDERTAKLLSAFELCVALTCAANDESRDIPGYNRGIKLLRVISDELRAIPPGRFAELAKFLDSPDIRLRGFAAVWLRHTMRERIFPILQEIAKHEPITSGVGTQIFHAMSELEREARDNTGKTGP
jgi:hypothetical protein